MRTQRHRRYLRPATTVLPGNGCWAKQTISASPNTSRWGSSRQGPAPVWVPAQRVERRRRDLNNPTQNVQAGTKYLKYLNERFDGNETKIIAAYNAGEGNVRRFGGIPPFKETRNYVKKVRNNEADFKQRVDSHIADVTASVGVVR